MSDDLIKKESDARRITIDDRPKLGEWYWVKLRVDEYDSCSIRGKTRIKRWKKNKKPKFEEVLLCASALGSNYVDFSCPVDERSHHFERIHNNDLYERIVRPEPNWKAILNQRIADKQAELQDAVKALADVWESADLLPQAASNEPPSLLPATTRADPKIMKQRLLAIKKHKYPKAKENVEQITKELVGLHEAMVLPQQAQFERMKDGMEEIDNRLFALHLYGGFDELIKQIAEGEPAPAETPVTVRQMMRFMDEETLWDYDKGGMNFEKLADFDKWAVKPENLNRLAPEPRCVVALRVRRHEKDYGWPADIAGYMEMEAKRKKDMETYLLIRNGQQVYRIATEVDFSPRLVPFRAEFHKPLVKTDEWYDWDSHDQKRTERVVTPADLEYDEHMKKRKDEVRHYNRVIFLLQGLLDRSKVFAPHPPVNLSDGQDVQRYLAIKYDEEDGLPSARPPVWAEYRDQLNATIKKGSWVWCGTYEDDKRTIYNRFGHWKRPKYGYDAARRPLVCQVFSVAKDRKTVVLRWPLGERTKTEWVIDKSRPVPNKPGYFYQKSVEHKLPTRHGRQQVKMEEVFAVEAYTPGDYKKFLCDAYLKGAYLDWAPQLLNAEKWHRDRSNKWA